MRTASRRLLLESVPPLPVLDVRRAEPDRGFVPVELGVGGQDDPVFGQLGTEVVERERAVRGRHRVTDGEPPDLRLALAHELDRHLGHRGARPSVLGFLAERARGFLVCLLELPLAVRLFTLLRELVRPRAGNRERAGYDEPHEKSRPKPCRNVHDSLRVAPISAAGLVSVYRYTWGDEGGMAGFRQIIASRTVVGS